MRAQHIFINVRLRLFFFSRLLFPSDLLGGQLNEFLVQLASGLDGCGASARFRTPGAEGG